MKAAEQTPAESSDWPFCGNRMEASKRTLMYQLGQRMDEIAFPVLKKPCKEWQFYSEAPILTAWPPVKPRTSIQRYSRLYDRLCRNAEILYEGYSPYSDIVVKFREIFTSILMTIRGPCLIGNPKARKLRVKVPLESETSGLLTLLSAISTVRYENSAPSGSS